MLRDLLQRIKSPQLYLLSYQRLFRILAKRVGCVPVVYPSSRIHGAPYHVPSAPESDDDVMAPLRRWRCP